MKLKKFIYAILLVALLLPGCRLEETAELDITLNFPMDYLGDLVLPEKLYFGIFNGDALLQQERVDFSTGRVSLRAPMGEDLVLAVLGSEIDASDSQEYAILIGSVGLNNLSEEGENRSITVSLKTFDEIIDSFAAVSSGEGGVSCSWNKINFPKTSYQVFLSYYDGDLNEKNFQVYDGADSSCEFNLEDYGYEPGTSALIGVVFYMAFDALGLRTKKIVDDFLDPPAGGKLVDPDFYFKSHDSMGSVLSDLRP